MTSKIWIAVLVVLLAGTAAGAYFFGQKFTDKAETTPTSSTTPGVQTSASPSPTSAAADSADKMTVLVYFADSKKMGECEDVFSQKRSIAKTQAVARASLNELLKGPTQAEQADGYRTNIPSGVILQDITIENGVAKADFNKKLEGGVAGACRVSAIRAQITKTLMQFPTVKSVQISIDGRTEDILQP